MFNVPIKKKVKAINRMTSDELKKELRKIKTDDIKMSLYLDVAVDKSLNKYNVDIDRTIITNSSNTCLMLYKMLNIEFKASRKECKDLEKGETIVQICHLRPKFDLKDISYMFVLIKTSDGWLKVSSYDEKYCLKIEILTDEQYFELKNKCKQFVEDSSLHGTPFMFIGDSYEELSNNWKDITGVKRDLNYHVRV